MSEGQPPPEQKAPKKQKADSEDQPKLKKQKAVSEDQPKPKKQKAVSEDQPKPKKPSVSHEASRFQYLCRTGQRGLGQSHAIKYGEGKVHETPESAQQAAWAWLANLSSLSSAGA